MNAVMDFAVPLFLQQGSCTSQIYSYHSLCNQNYRDISEGKRQCALMYLVDRVSSEIPLQAVLSINPDIPSYSVQIISTSLGRHSVSIPKGTWLILCSDRIIANCEHHVKTVSILKGSPVTGLEWPRGFQEVKVKVKQSRYRPGVTQRVPGS